MQSSWKLLRRIASRCQHQFTTQPRPTSHRHWSVFNTHTLCSEPLASHTYSCSDYALPSPQRFPAQPISMRAQARLATNQHCHVVDCYHPDSATWPMINSCLLTFLVLAFSMEGRPYVDEAYRCKGAIHCRIDVGNVNQHGTGCEYSLYAPEWQSYRVNLWFQCHRQLCRKTGFELEHSAAS